MAFLDRIRSENPCAWFSGFEIALRIRLGTAMVVSARRSKRGRSQLSGYQKRFQGLALHLKHEKARSEPIVLALAGSKGLISGHTYAVSFVTPHGVPSN
jgi:hypothetical protein